MQARIESVIGVTKQHARIALLLITPRHIFGPTVTDYIQRKTSSVIWASPDRNGKLSTPHSNMQPAFTGTMSTVAIPFRCRVISELPKLHRQVTNKSFGNRSAEGIYLYSDETPAIHMFLLSRKEVIVSDFLAYHDQFPPPALFDTPLLYLY